MKVKTNNILCDEYKLYLANGVIHKVYTILFVELLK